jgi:hypothetical protein
MNPTLSSLSSRPRLHARNAASALRPALAGLALRLALTLSLLIIGGLSLAAPSSAGPRQSDPDCADFVSNGGFETGDLSGWEREGQVGVDDYAHAGSWAASLGGEHNAEEWIAQSYTLPPDPLEARLRYWLFIGSEETGTGAYDHLRIEAQDAGGALLAELGAWNNSHASELWRSGNVDLREYPALLGQPFRLVFRASTDGSLATHFYLDDLSLEVCEGGTACLDPYEPNDDFEQAADFDPGADFFGRICDAEDHDFFRFQVGAGDLIVAHLDGEAGAPLPADFELALYGPDRDFVAKSERPGGQPEDIQQTADRTGTWFLRVYGYQGASSQDGVYRLRADLNPVIPASATPTPASDRTATPTPASGIDTATPTPTVDDPIGASSTPTPVGFETATSTPTARYPGCADPYEPNNSRSESLWSILNAPRLSYLCAADDWDFWKIEGVAISQTLEVRLWDLPADYLLELFRPDGSLARRSDHAGTAAERIRFTADQSGDWLARVTSLGAYDAARPYTVSASSFACSLDQREGELGNDDKDHATGLDTPGSEGWTEAALSLCPAGDEDWFSVPLSTGRRLEAEIAHTRGQDHVKLCLLDRDGKTILVCTPGQAGSEKLEREIKEGQAGTYYLRAVAADAAHPINAWYNLNLRAPRPTETPTASPVPSATATPAKPYPRCPDVYELNDSPTEASTLPASGWVEAFMCSARTVTGPDGKPRSQPDEDWWKVSVAPEAGNPSQVILAQMDLLDYEIEWFGPDGKTSLGRGRSASGKLPSTASATAARGTYYLRVRESARQGYDEVSPYRLTVSTASCSDRYEPNDDFGEAQSIALAAGATQTRKALICHDGDRDLFYVQAQTGQQIDATLIGFHDYELRLYDPWYQRIARNSTGIRHVAQVSGRYYLEVASRSGSRSSRSVEYELGLSLGVPPALDRRDVWLMDLEVNQRLQTADNDLPLFTDLPTMVRLYAGTQDVGRVTLIQPMRAYLTGKLNGKALKPAQLACSSLPQVGYTDGTSSYLRESLNRSLNCVLPSAWISATGQLELVGHVYAPGVDESSPSNNQRSVTLALEKGVPVMLRTVQVRDCGDPKNCGPEKGPAFADYSSVHRLAERMFPLSKIVLEPPGSRWVRADGLNGTHSALLSRFGSLINERNGFVDVVFGASKTLDPFWGGVGTGLAFWSQVDKGNAPQLAAHEMGHALGLNHVDACKLGPAPPHSTYPGAPKLDVAGHRSAFGLDMGASPIAVKSSQGNHDIMSYCYDWISRFHYTTLRSNLRFQSTRQSGGGSFLGRAPGAGQTAAASQTAEQGSASDLPSAPSQELDPDARYVGVFGIVDPLTDRVSSTDLERMVGSQVSPYAFGPDEGHHILRFEDASGRSLTERRFELRAAAEAKGPSSFAVLLPDLPEMAHLVILREGREIHRASKSSAAPRLSLDPLPPLSGSAISPTWTAEDADGDALRSTVYLSLDDGRSWRMELAGQPTDRGQTSSLRLDTRQWPAAAAARLRVRVSDGLREAEAISPPFAIPGKPPEAWIATPVEGGPVAPEAPVLLSGGAWDPEDGSLEGRSLVWSSDREGRLGIGASLLLPELSPGWHRLELAATDAQGNRALAEIRVFVGWRSYVPFAVQAR